MPGTRFEYWDTDEPSERGIDGIERMRLVRDDSADRVADLLDRVQTRLAGWFGRWWRSEHWQGDRR